MAEEVFVLGAGFSKAISHHMPSLQELGTLVRARGGLPGRLARLEMDVEMALTYLAQPHPWNTEAEKGSRDASMTTGSQSLSSAAVYAVACGEHASANAKTKPPDLTGRDS